MEKIMNIWMKGCSLVVIGLVIYAIYLAFQFVGLYFDSQEIFYQFLALGEYTPKTMPLSSTIFWVFGCLVSAIFTLVFYFPSLYYAWAKKPYIKEMKSWAKILSVCLIVCFVLGLISSWGLSWGDKDTFLILSYILFQIPLYYYAWRKEDDINL